MAPDAQEEDGQDGVDQQHIFHRVAHFTAIIACAFRRLLGGLYARFDPVVTNSGEVGVPAASAGEAHTSDGVCPLSLDVACTINRKSLYRVNA